MISKDLINKFSKKFAIDEFTIIREYIQVVFLSELFGSKASEKIYFKGGTAIRLLLKSGRFSEDLDFTSTLLASELDKTIKDTVKKMSLTVPGISIKRTEENKFSYTGILRYQPENFRYPLNIHLDFSFREKPETLEKAVLETDFPVVFRPVIIHIGWQEILAEKIRALLYRSKGRDVYDLWFMLSKGIEIDWKMTNRKMKFYDMTASSGDVGDKILNFDFKNLANDLGKFLPAPDRGIIPLLKVTILEKLKS